MKAGVNQRRRRRYIMVAAIILVVAVVVSVFVFIEVPSFRKPDIFVGVDVGFGDEQDVYKVANAVQGYANLIVLGSSTLTSQTENLTRVCDYLHQHGFSFIIYIAFSISPTGLPPKGPDAEFFNRNRERWGDSMLGMYIFDEPGGKQLDYNISNPDKPVAKADNIGDASIHYVLGVEPYATLYRGDTYYAAQWLRLFTSDYGLYWFDYLAGYRVVLGEFTGNNSRQITIASSRGAADVQGRDWGAMITWKYDNPPYLEGADQLLDDMKLAYDNGAKYIVVFNSPHFTAAGSNPPITPYGILTDDHLGAMKRFWDYAKTHTRPQLFHADTAYVLPRDWGFGFRRPDDNIWGLWPADSLAPKVWNDTQQLLTTNGMNLDIVYETRIDNVPITLPYKTLIFWNGTTVNR